ncbi:Oidioi.mRNA.OKI2018_I69.chr2.g7611.t1.cds [Oikopleura dioica]|uniref:Oidioi.mRNA.OKI2018_I69.chr2.g7611.t1.cds n=1 Tax=Oikopleura dioica TaxID=34765 RepID=A0ABN7TA77_OIKDI|nr:Oidioi.mRNA.OKI2018_I69.chr2.g7611.t1.cds [Oikopleura dioica]
MSKLQQVLTDREKQPRPTSMIAMSDAESGTDSRPPKANGTPDRSRKAPVLAKLKMQSSTSNDRDHQPKTEPVLTNHKKIESSQPVVVKPEVTKNDLDRISDTFNSQLSEKDSPSPMTVAPRKKTLDEIFDVDELEKMLDEEDDYEARKAIRSRLRSLHKAKTAEIENRQKSKNQPPLNIPTTDDEIVVEKRTRSRARVQRSMSSVASLQSSTASNDRFGDKKTDLGRVSRTPSQASLREDDFGAAESSSSPSPSESSIRARPQTAQPKSSSVSASPKTQVRPSTAKPSSISQTVETAGKQLTNKTKRSEVINTRV